MIKKNTEDKTPLILLLSGLIVLLIYLFVFTPLAEKVELNKSQIRQKQVELLELKGMKLQLEKLKQDASLLQNKFSQKDKAFSLFSFLDELAGKTNIKSNINYMKPSSYVDSKTQAKISAVKMEIKDIDMGSFFDFLYQIEASKNLVFITDFAISKKNENDTLVSIVMQAQTTTL